MNERPTQRAQILAILADGDWHSSRQLHREVFCVLHSRIAELRRRGYVIEHQGGGGGAENHFYRLVPPQEQAA